MKPGIQAVPPEIQHGKKATQGCGTADANSINCAWKSMPNRLISEKKAMHRLNQHPL
jgi:hypothetical protein